MATQQQIDMIYQTYQRQCRRYEAGEMTYEELDVHFKRYLADLEKAGPVREPYTNELCFRTQIGNAYYYRHQECGNPGYLGYTNVNRAECHPHERCIWCGGLIGEAPRLDFDL